MSLHPIYLLLKEIKDRYPNRQCDLEYDVHGNRHAQDCWCKELAKKEWEEKHGIN